MNVFVVLASVILFYTSFVSAQRILPDWNFCKNKTNDNHSNPYNCSTYITCHNDRMWVRPCPPGLLWNSDKKYCDWPRNVKCQSKSTTGSPPTAATTKPGQGTPPQPIKPPAARLPIIGIKCLVGFDKRYGLVLILDTNVVCVLEITKNGKVSSYRLTKANTKTISAKDPEIVIVTKANGDKVTWEVSQETRAVLNGVTKNKADKQLQAIWEALKDSEKAIKLLKKLWCPKKMPKKGRK